MAIKVRTVSLQNYVTKLPYLLFGMLPEISFPNHLNSSPTHQVVVMSEIFVAQRDFKKDFMQLPKTSVECKQKIMLEINQCKHGEIKIKLELNIFKQFVSKLGNI